MKKQEQELLELGLGLAAVWFGLEVVKGLITSKCPNCGEQIQGKPSVCPHCHNPLWWGP